MATYKSISLVQRPSDKKIGPHLFETKELDIPEVKDGQILIKQTHMSLDPAMLGWMSEDRESYIPPVELGVTEEMALCVFALPGLTATTGLYNFGHPKEGETIVVTGAAGSVGSMVGQLAKADGLRVIGVVGSDEKADWIVNELGFDGAINYKTDDIESKLAELTPDKVDVYFENTGGPIQHHVFNRMNAHGRIVVCGMIADYQADEPSAGPNWIPLIKKRITIRGFAMPDHWGELPQLLEKLTPYVQQGKIKYRAHAIDGLENAEKGLNMLFEGKNTGKMIVKL